MKSPKATQGTNGNTRTSLRYMFNFCGRKYFFIEMWAFGIGWKLQLLFFALFVILCRHNVYSKPLPEQKSSDGAGGTVTQTGEPSHFQVDDKAAEIEVNANPAGVKVNAKPASLQVVAKPGTPAIPIFHPSIHLTPHYSPPPLIHHHPASFYQGWGHPGSFPWMSGGLKRNRLPVAKESAQTTRKKTHKSDIPRAVDDGRKGGKSNKRQFIQNGQQFIQNGQQFVQPGQLGYLPSPPLGVSPQTSPRASLLSGLGALAALSPLPQYAPSYPMQGSLTPQTRLQEYPLSRNVLSMRPQNLLYPRVYPSTQRMLPSRRSYAGLYQSVGDLQGLLYPGLVGQQAFSPFDSSMMGSRQAPGYAREYLPYTPLSKPGMPSYGQLSPQSMLSLLGLQLLPSSTPRVFRSKIPGSKRDKTPKRSPDKVNSDPGRRNKRQVLLQQPERTSGLDNLMQDELTDDLLKRQLIINPQLQLQTLTNQQQLQDIASQQASLHTLVGQQPALQLTQSLLRQSAQSALSNLPQSITINPLQPPLDMLASNYISPIQTPFRPQLVSPRMSQPARLATSPFARQVMPIRFATEQPSMSMLGLSQLTGPQGELSYQNNSPFHRKSFRRPVYRRRLHRPQEYGEEERTLPEEDGPLGDESVSQGDSYIQDPFPGQAGKTLLDTSHAGFGTITVEAKTAEGERLAPDEKRRDYLERPIVAKKPMS